jgi:sec-independent protein translocase protein TatC
MPERELLDPDNYRMSLGEHLEELRRRLIRALIGFAIAIALCAWWGSEIVSFFCRPLVEVLAAHHLSPQLVYTQVGESVTLYLYVVAVCAAVIASPWMLYQLWLFIAAGLYPREQRIVWRYAPVSLALLVAGIVFCYLIVLPASMNFFIEFGGAFPLPNPTVSATTAPAIAAQPLQLPALAADPTPATPYTLWFNVAEHRLKLALPGDAGPSVMTLQFAPTSLLVPFIRVSDYVDMVLLWLLIFAIAFQMPLVQMAVVRAGLVSLETLRAGRRYAYLGITIIAALLMPDVFSGTLALMGPLIVLYELGLLLARWSEPKPVL